MRLDPTEHGSIKMDAIRTALVVNGRIQHGAMRSLELLPPGGGDGDGDSAPRSAHFYQALFKVQETAPTPILPVAAAAVATPAPDPAPAPPPPAHPTMPKSQTGSRLGSIKVE